FRLSPVFPRFPLFFSPAGFQHLWFVQYGAPAVLTPGIARVGFGLRSAHGSGLLRTHLLQSAHGPLRRAATSRTLGCTQLCWHGPRRPGDLDLTIGDACCAVLSDVRHDERAVSG